MRPLRVSPIAVAGLLLATGLVGVFAPLASASPTSAANAGPATAHPDVAVTVYSTDASGYVSSDFYTGYDYGEVFFEVFNALDNFTTIHLNDLNATRDGLTNPVFTYVANTSTGANYSFDYNLGYLIPLSLVYAGLWNITATGATAGFSSFQFYVHTYYPEIDTTQSQFLPGSTVTAKYYVFGSPNNAPFDHAMVTVTGDYETNTSTTASLFATRSFGTAEMGNFSFTVPANASTDGFAELEIWANQTAPAPTNASEFNDGYFGTSNLSTPMLSLGACAWGCGSSSAFVSGQTAFLNIQEWIVGHYGSTAAAGMDVALSFRAGTSAVTVPSVPTTLVTNATGGAEVAFIASNSVFSTTSTNEINVTVTDPTDAGLGTFVGHIFFAVTTQASVAPELLLTLNSVQYYGGDTATVNWEMGGLNATVTQGWTVGSWYAYEENGADTVIAWGFANSSAVTGAFSFAIPLNFGGTILVELTAYNASTDTAATAYATVTAPTILLNPSEAYYLPGDSVTVAVTTEGSIFTSTTLYATVSEPSGNRLVSGVLTGNQVQFTIPTTGAPDYVTISVAAQSMTLGIVAAATTYIDEGTGYQLLVGVTTKSNYADGSFQPGQTIQLSYALVAVGPTTVLPRNLYVYVYPGSTDYYGSEYGAIQVETSATSGTLSYTIPSSTPAGNQQFSVYAEAVTCGYSCGAANTFSVFVEPNPSVLGMDLGAGSGLTVGWLILLVIIIVVAIVLVLMIRRRGGRGSMTPEPVKPYSPSPSPPTSSGGTGGSGAAWQEPPPSGASSPPPMPQPPAR